jgi:hypothetical protein
MMPVIRVNDATFVDLKAISKWLETKTPTETIDALVRDKMLELGRAKRNPEEEDAYAQKPFVGTRWV